MKLIKVFFGTLAEFAQKNNHELINSNKKPIKIFTCQKQLEEFLIECGYCRGGYEPIEKVAECLLNSEHVGQHPKKGISIWTETEDLITVTDDYGNSGIMIDNYNFNIKGDLINGYHTDENGERHTNIENTTITRPIIKITEDKIYCPCGRVFLINENLYLEKCNY